jgi:hypothetical protein
MAIGIDFSQISQIAQIKAALFYFSLKALKNAEGKKLRFLLSE